ncbi:MAG: tRNA (adenosine(37)-N6)-threonylcarbamoyltransferase complex dimerization subunit type 1 TsaB [Bacteroidota bacterium]
MSTSPNILLLETATDICSVGISQQGKLLSEVTADAPFVHGEQLTLQIQECCEAAKLTLTDLDAIALSAGPGSYTALRIGTATAKGICYALQKPLLAVDTLHAIALATIATHPQPNAIYIPMIDARRMEVYTAYYDGDGSTIEPVHAAIINEESFNELLQTGKSLLLSGNGAEKCQSILPQQDIFYESIRCAARNLIPIAMQKWEQQHFESLAYFEPTYLKPPNITTPKKRL